MNIYTVRPKEIFKYWKLRVKAVQPSHHDMTAIDIAAPRILLENISAMVTQAIGASVIDTQAIAKTTKISI